MLFISHPVKRWNEHWLLGHWLIGVLAQNRRNFRIIGQTNNKMIEINLSENTDLARKNWTLC